MKSGTFFDLEMFAFYVIVNVLRLVFYCFHVVVYLYLIAVSARVAANGVINDNKIVNRRLFPSAARQD